MRIGIDLGTTFSVVAQMKGGQPEVIPNREGGRLTPSVVLVQEDGQVVVGETAKDQAVILPQGVVTAVKNYMGKQHTYHLPDGKDYTPEMISSFILSRIVQDAERLTGEKVDGAVVTIPAYFTDAQRKATEDAATLAGLPLLATINEPTAAAIYYASRAQEARPMNILVYDLGGGTFDATVIRANGLDIKVLSTHGLSGVGGKVFDQALVDYVCQVFSEKHGLDLKSEDYLDEYQELVLKAENCKIQLSSQDSAVIPLRVGKAKESIPVTREFLEAEVLKLYRRTEASVKKAVREAGLTFEQLDKVVLVGGSSRIPLIQAQIGQLTGHVPSLDVNPDEAVALGAAIYAGLVGSVQDEKQVTVSDVCSHSIGIVVISKALQETNHILIRRNSSIPCSVEETMYTTMADQASIRLTLTEGEFAEMCDVTQLATQTIDLPKNLPQGTEVAVILELDAGQLLHFYVKIPAAGIHKEYTISRSQNMDPAQVEELAGRMSAGRAADIPRDRDAAAKTQEPPPPAPAPAPHSGLPEPVDRCLDGVVGMEQAKEVLTAVYTAVKVQNARANYELNSHQRCHFFLRGDQGSGKTLLSERIGSLLCDLGLTQQAAPCVLDGIRLGDFLGNDGSGLEEALEKCDGRVVVIDGLSALFEEGGESRPKLLRTVLEQYRERANFLLCGTEKDVEHLLTVEPTLTGMFLYDITIKPYTPEELADIAQRVAQSKGYTFSTDARAALIQQMENERRSPAFRGGKTLEALVERAGYRLAQRLNRSGTMSKGTLMRIEAEDLDQSDSGDLEAQLAQLDSLTGLASVKEQVHRLTALAKANREAQRLGLGSAGFGTLHMIFTGNAGTGKTTVARIIGGIYKALGILPKGDKLVECVRADLVAQYVGHTAPKVKAKVAEAMGGVLFIDEAYSLCGDHDSFGQEAVDTLVSEIENHRADLMVILAGYTEDMDKFLNKNQGLSSRFPNRMEFTDYTQSEMEDIFLGMLKGSGKRLAGDHCRELLNRYIAENRGKKGFGNARGIRNLRDKLIEVQSLRLSAQMEQDAHLGGEDFATITVADLEQVVDTSTRDKSLEEQLDALRALTGLQSVKEQVERKVYTVLAQKKMKEQGMGQKLDFGTLHMVFKGNAGTGKTTVARIIARIYNTLGLLPDGDTFVECSRADLVGQYQGQTAPKVKEVVDRALGGVLFIDEAYSLCRDQSDTFGHEAVDALIALMENNRKNLMVILAGYSDDMDRFFESNQGFASRVPTELIFEDYTLDELSQIFQSMVTGKGFTITQEAMTAARAIIDRERTTPGFGNARGVRNIAERIIERHTARLGSILSRGQDPSQEDYISITTEDIP